MDIKAYIREKREKVDDALRRIFPQSDGFEKELISSMRYSLFAGGKRLRPILCIASCEAVGGDESICMPVACALELIHTYSLIHDDLPSMDDDELRRGKPTNHMVFGEAMALLAGDGLLTEAFYLLSSASFAKEVGSDRSLEIIRIISEAAGFRGMVGGQAVDIRSEGEKKDKSVVEYIHRHKTGALIRASVISGGIAGRGTEDQIEALSKYGERIGLAFQIMDDILDVEGEIDKLGKHVGMDEKRGKLTFPSVFGMERAKEINLNLIDEAVSYLNCFDSRAEPLREIALYIINRTG